MADCAAMDVVGWGHRKAEGASVFLAPLERLAVGFRVGVALQQTTPMAPYVSGARVFLGENTV